MSSVLPVMSGVQEQCVKRLRAIVMTSSLLIGTGFAAFHLFWARSDVNEADAGLSAASQILRAVDADRRDGLSAVFRAQEETVKKTNEPFSSDATYPDAGAINYFAQNQVDLAEEKASLYHGYKAVKKALSGAQKGGDSTSVSGSDVPGPKEHVLHITNIGDKIIITDESNNIIFSYSAFRREGEVSKPDAYMADDQQGYVSRRAAFDEAYPGCPEALPEGSSKQDAEQLLQDYGCRYRRSCTADTDEQVGTCIWYFTGRKV